MPRTPVTVIVVTHNAAAFIATTLAALRDDPSGPEEVLVVDSGSTDSTGAVVAAFGVGWHPLGSNLGYGAAVAAGFERARHDVVAALGDDVVAAAGWLTPLVAALENPTVGAAMATIELADQPGRFNTSGGAMTVTGVAWITDHGKPVDNGAPVDVAFPSGGALAMRRQVWDQVGGMRSDFFLYHEDTDLGWRLRLQGLRTVRVPESRVFHGYEFGRAAKKLSLLERNRWLMLLANYRRSTLLLLAPVLALQEAGVMGVALRDGWLGAKLGTWSDIVHRRAETRHRHRRVQASRTVGDAAILRSFVGRVSDVAIPGVQVPAGAKLFDRFTTWWVRMVVGTVGRIDRRRGLTT